MKKIKLLIPTLATIGSLAAAAPILTACNKKGDEPTVEFTVHFETNGGSTIADVKVKKGGLVTEPEKPTKEGYAFTGWFKDKELTQGFNFKEEKINADTTIYAKWNQTGTTVTEAEWKQAFADLADTRQELNFWTDGSIVDVQLHGGKVVQTVTFSDVIFNGNRHYGYMDVKDEDTGDVAVQNVAGEYFNDYFFYANQILLGETPVETEFDVGYNTQVTEIFYNIYDTLNGKYSDYEFDYKNDEYVTKSTVTTYKSKVKFMKDDKEATKRKVQKFVFEKNTAEDKWSIDITVNYGKKEFTLPEGWDDSRPLGVSAWQENSKTTNIYKHKEMANNVISPFIVGNSQAGCKTVKFTTENGQPILFNNYDVAICITHEDSSTHEITTTYELLDTTHWVESTGVWTIQAIATNGLVQGDRVSFLVHYGEGDVTIKGELAQ